MIVIMGVAAVMMATLSRNGVTSGSHGELAMLHAAGTHQLVSKLLEQMPLTLHHQHLKAVVMIQMDMQHRLDLTLKGVLEMGQIR